MQSHWQPAAHLHQHQKRPRLPPNHLRLQKAHRQKALSTEHSIRSKRAARSISGYSPIKIPSDTWMKTANIRDYVSTEAANRVEYLETGKVDIVLANFTVTAERAEKVDFALPYMNVALGVVSPDSRVISDLSQLGAEDEVIVISGTTAEDYLIKNNPEIKLQKYDTYANAKNALENGNAAAWANDNTEVIAYALQNPGYTVGIPSLGSQDTIAPAVSKGNESLLNWINDEIKALAAENFFHKDYEATLVDTYGLDYEESLVVEGGVPAAAAENG